MQGSSQRVLASVAVSLGCAVLAAAADTAVTLQSLLNEMTDPEAVALWPEPAYACRQASSYDRRAKATNDNWFANTDNMDSMGADLRWEEHQGRKECLMMETDGPGAIVRFWTGGNDPKGKVRFYLDGADAPAIEASMFDLMRGADFVPRPIAIMTAGKALNFYLPVPFAKHCKITYDEGNPPRPPPGRWFNIEYRIYPPGTKVETFSMDKFKTLSATLADVTNRLSNPPQFAGGETVSVKGTVEPGRELSLELPRGSKAIRTLTVKCDTPAAGYESVLRSTILKATFDTNEAVWCPIDAFFGTGIGLNAVQSWTRTVETNGTLSCRWVMPYRKSASLSLLNLGSAPVSVSLDAVAGKWKWTDRSMYFHSTWRYQDNIPTRPYSEWNYVELAGKAVYVGDTLVTRNPAGNWWGEGDEKIWVDGEGFPSHFGTGTEDYYGYAWGNTDVFQGPFCNQPRAANPGYTVVTRTRSLDAIPATRSLKLDMEIWHWADCKTSYGVASYWYGAAGTTSNRKPQPEQTAASVTQK